MFHRMKYITSNINFMADKKDDQFTPLGLWIKSALEKKGKNQAWLAEQVGVQPPQITRIMKGQSETTPQLLGNIATKLSRTRSEIFRAAGFIESLTPEDAVDEGLLFQSRRLPLDERERWVRRIESDANDYEQRKTARQANKKHA